METFETKSLEQTYELGRSLAPRLNVGDLVALTGDLGAGKTALVRGLSIGLGVGDARIVSSPTFVLVHEYEGRVPVYHIDLYRMSEPAEELVDLGLDEMLGDGVVLVEWAERAGDALPPHWRVRIEHVGETARRFEITSPKCADRASRRRAGH
jgi:tRNA threonylcarbamoyladenosine biosynthesis protein TsaE